MVPGLNVTTSGARYELYGFDDDIMVVRCRGANKESPTLLELREIKAAVWPGVGLSRIRTTIRRGTILLSHR